MTEVVYAVAGEDWVGRTEQRVEHYAGLGDVRVKVLYPLAEV